MLNVTSGSNTMAATATISPRRTHFQLICPLAGNRPPAPPPPGGGPPGPPPRGGLGGGGVPSRAALTSSIGSRSGIVSSVIAGMTAVGRASGAGPRGGAGRRITGGGSLTRSSLARSPGRAGARSAPPSLWMSVADRSGRSPLLTGRARAVSRRPGAPRSLGGTQRAEHIRLDQVIPAAGPAYLHHVYRKLFVAGGQHHQFLRGTGRTRNRAEVIAEHPRHQCQLLLATDRAHHRAGLAVVLRSPQQVGVGIADLRDTGAPGVHLGQQ